jgi:hypothetical protein
VWKGVVGIEKNEFGGEAASVSPGQLRPWALSGVEYS